MKIGYDEISPITQKKCVLKELLYEDSNGEGVYAKICFESGYNTITTHTESNEKMEEIEEKFPDIIRDSKFTDEFGFNWYLSAMNLGVVMLYPEPTPDGEKVPWFDATYQWVVMPVSLNSDMSFKLDEDLATYFKASEFELAFDKLHEIAQLHYNTAEL